MKRLISAAAAVAVAAALLCLPCAAEGGTVTHKYVAFGDSIAFGYALPDIESQCFVGLTAAELGLDYTNRAISGTTSSDLLKMLNNYSDSDEAYGEIASAALITVTIGSNDVLGPLTNIWNTVISDAGGAYDDNTYAMLEAALNTVDATTSFDNGISQYQSDLPQIYARLREINPTVQIIMTQFYNPYYGVMLGDFDFSAMCDTYICQMNDILAAGQSTMKYDIAEVYAPFNAAGMTNVDAASNSYDPHPNPTGHLAIRDAVLAKVDRAAVAAVLASETVTEEAETTSAETSAAETSSASAETTAAETEEQTSAASNSHTAVIVAVIAAVAVGGAIVISVTMDKKKKNRK